MNEKFSELRQKHQKFIYNSFSLTREEEFAVLSFDFEIEGLCCFKPVTKLRLDSLELKNGLDSPEAQRLAFAVGMAEIVSYWKCACPPQVLIRCGSLDEQDVLWWKKLWWGGLGEFFYVNSIETDFDSFVSIASSGNGDEGEFSFNSAGLVLVPVGGGKDSDVTLSLLQGIKSRLRCFTVNDQQARSDAVLAAGLTAGDIVAVYRTIDRRLLELNAQGYLNGHTPFSSVVAFLGALSCYLIGAESLVLSNESSANEASVFGAEVNHQYSKSYEFEKAFDFYVQKHFGGFMRYFSLLRPFNEVQIAKKFAALPQYHTVFRSCNAGSKRNIWCCSCAKCLFVYIILSPFLTQSELTAIFGENLLDKTELLPLFDELRGLGEKKPFECVGTVSEVNAALAAAKAKILTESAELPKLLENVEPSTELASLLGEFNGENNIPSEFLGFVKEMYSYVKGTD